MNQKYTIRKINPFSVAKFSWLLGSLGMILPSIICAIGSLELITVLQILLQKLQNVNMGLFGKADFIKMLNLEVVSATLTQWSDQSSLLVMLIMLGGVVVGGLLIGLISLLLSLVYNLVASVTGGIEVEAELSKNL